MAPAGVVTRTWASCEEPTGRIPGITTIGFLPSSLRIIAASTPEATTPSAPNEIANRALFRTVSRTDSAMPISTRSASSKLVSTVTARIFTALRPRPSTAARTVCPVAWALRNVPPRSAAAAVARFTVSPMSSSLRSRKTRLRCARAQRTMSGPAAVKSSRPIFTNATESLTRSSRRLASSADSTSIFFFKQKTAYEVGLGIPAEPLFRSKDTRDYLAAAFPELNAWERAGADASSAGMVDAGFENQKELTKMQLDNQKEIAEMQNETQKEIAGIQSATSRQNTKDQVYAQNEMLAYQQKESTARVASIMENTNLSKQQQVSEIMRQMLTQAQTAGQYFTNDQIKEMTRKVSAEVDLVHQQTQNQRYGSSHIGATAKDISNVVTDAASGVVDIFHGIDKAVADTWNNFWKDGKADGIGSNLSRK